MESRFPAAPVAAPGSSLLGESGLNPAGVWSCWLSCSSWVRCLQPCCLPCHIPKVWTAEVCQPVQAEFLPRSLCWWDSQMGFTFFLSLLIMNFSLSRITEPGCLTVQLFYFSDQGKPRCLIEIKARVLFFSLTSFGLFPLAFLIGWLVLVFQISVSLFIEIDTSILVHFLKKYVIYVRF